jgi:hypothetical protein
MTTKYHPMRTSLYRYGCDPCPLLVGQVVKEVVDKEATNKRAVEEAMVKEAANKEVADRRATEKAVVKEAEDKEAADNRAMEEAGMKEVVVGEARGSSASGQVPSSMAGARGRWHQAPPLR